jgi:hypothetical protein
MTAALAMIMQSTSKLLIGLTPRLIPIVVERLAIVLFGCFVATPGIDPIRVSLIKDVANHGSMDFAELRDLAV